MESHVTTRTLHIKWFLIKTTLAEYTEYFKEILRSSFQIFRKTLQKVVSIGYAF